MWLFWNNDFYEQTSISISPNNRSFRYGDGLFESMLWKEAQIPLWKAHWERLQHGLKILGIQLTSSETFVQKTIAQLVYINHLQTARIRLMVYRGGKGTYLPSTDQGILFIEAHPIIQSPNYPIIQSPNHPITQSPNHPIIQSSNHLSLVQTRHALSLLIYREMSKPCHLLSNLKTNNCLISILAARYAHQQGADDAIILNDRGTIAEATSSNIFIRQAGKLYTPPLSDAPLAGVMRAEWIRLAQERGDWGAERSITIEELQDADEIWLTNAIRGGRRAALVE